MEEIISIDAKLKDPTERFYKSVSNKPKPENEDKKKTRPEDWKYNNSIIRYSHFDERVLKDGRPTAVPRVITVAWVNNKETGITKYGACIWTKLNRSDDYIRKECNKYALNRLNDDPILISFNEMPKTNKEIAYALRWLVHRFGVDKTGRKYKNCVKLSQGVKYYKVDEKRKVTRNRKT